MAEMHTVFIETNFETRLALLLHKDDHVSAFKDKFCKEHAQCFPKIGEITVFALKVNWQGQYYHLSDSMILSKAFEAISSEWFIFVDVASVEEKLDPTHEEALQIQAAEEKTKKRKMKSSSSAPKSRKKLVVVPNQCALVDVSKDIDENVEGNVISLGENQKTSCDVNQEGLVDANQTLEEAVESDLGMKPEVPEENLDLDLSNAMKKDLENGETIAATADIVMDNLLPTTDAENERVVEDGVNDTSEPLPNSGVEKVSDTHVEAILNDNEKVDNGDEEAKPVKPKRKTKSRKDKIVPKEETLVATTTPNAVLALSAVNVESGGVTKVSQEIGETTVKKSSKRSKKKQSENIVE